MKRKHNWAEFAHRMGRSAEAVRGRSKKFKKLMKLENGALENSVAPIPIEVDVWRIQM